LEVHGVVVNLQDAAGAAEKHSENKPSSVKLDTLYTFNYFLS